MPSFGLSARSIFFVALSMITAASISGYLSILIRCFSILSVTVLTIGFTVPVNQVPRPLRPTFFFVMVQVYHLLLLGLRPYWRIKDLLRTIPILERQLQHIHEDLTHLLNLAPAQVNMQEDVAAFAAIMSRMLEATVATRAQLAAQNDALHALTAAVGLARTAHQTSNDFLLTMSETLQLLTATLRDIGEDFTLPPQFQVESRWNASTLPGFHKDSRKTRNQRKRTLSVLSDKSIKVAKKRREEEEEEERSARAEDDDDDDDVNEEGAKKTGKQRKTPATWARINSKAKKGADAPL
ncbi:hypothetical protein JOM56_004635 [Amanita muscaria]